MKQRIATFGLMAALALAGSAVPAAAQQARFNQGGRSYRTNSYQSGPRYSVSYYGGGHGYRDNRVPFRHVATVGGGIAVGALIGGASGRAQGAVIGAFAGGLAGLALDRLSDRHHGYGY